MRLDLLTNAIVVDDAIRFVSEKQQQHSSKETRSKNNDDNADANCSALSNLNTTV